MKEVVVLILVIVLLPLSIPLVKSLSIDLIHVDSPLSPFYNASMTESEILINAVMRSNSRMKSFHLAALNESKFETTISPGARGEYIMQIFLGEPPVETYASPDTGSDLIWFQCLPCEECFDQNFPIYNPNGSTGYESIECYEDYCRDLKLSSCSERGLCKYEQNYGDKSYTKGDLAKDTLSFRSHGGQMESFPKTIMGCGHDNNGLFTASRTGLVGFGGGSYSIVRQLGNLIGRIFSYCLLPLTATHQNSTMKVGSVATISGDRVVTTPMVTKYPPTFYYLSLESVSVEGKVVKPVTDVDSIIIDSGTTLTYLKRSFYDNIEAAVKDAIGVDILPAEEPITPFNLCYMDGTIKNVPNITFQFSNADYGLQLLPMHIFVSLENMQCFLMFPTDGTSILGNRQQVSFQVEYNLEVRTVSFATKDCSAY